MDDVSTQTGREGWIWPSTRSFLEEARQTPGVSAFDTLHGYAYSRWPYLYMSVATGEHRLIRMFKPLAQLIGQLFALDSNPNGGQGGASDKFHGKVLTTEAARQLVTVQEDIRLDNLERVIPYRFARDIILKNPHRIVAVECPCRAARAEPCLPLDVCLVVGDPFASFIAEHHPQRARWIDSEEACHILAAEHDQGHVHHAFFKDAMLGRFYAICNCCPCCCGAMQAMRNGMPLLASSGYTSTVDPGLCNSCGACVRACPFGAIELLGPAAEADQQACMGCGVCVSACELGARSLIRDPGKSEPLEVHTLLAQVQQCAEETCLPWTALDERRLP